MAAGKGGNEGVEQQDGDGLVLLVQAGEALHGLPVSPQLCLVGLHVSGGKPAMCPCCRVL